jgi:hypothetical protein
MNRERIEFLAAVPLLLSNPTGLADFYRDVVGVLLEEERPRWLAAPRRCNLGQASTA